MKKVKPPYNIGSLAQEKALEVLGNEARFRAEVEEIKRERERLVRCLRGMDCFERVFDSEANFVLACSARYREVYRWLADGGIVVRVRHVPPRLPGGLRVTVGRREENDMLIERLNDFVI